MKKNTKRLNAAKSGSGLIDASAASKLLGVSVATLYAYVSRGLVRSTPDPHRAKASLYVASDIQTLIERKARMRQPRAAAASALEFGLPVLKTHLTHFEDGRLFYRQQDAVEFSKSATLEDAARLLWNTGDDDPFPDVSFDPREIPGWIATSRRFHQARAIDRACALLPFLTLTDSPHTGQSGPLAFRSAARLLLAVTSASAPLEAPITSAIHKALAKAWERPAAADILRRSLVLLADHELNPSTFAVRVVASTGARHTHCVLGGLAALSGRRHGAASIRAAEFLDHIRAPSDAVNAVGARIESGSLLPGFGHTLYREGDPRAAELLRHFELDPVSAATLQAARDMMGVEPNVDFVMAAIERRFKLPPRSSLAIFSIARTVGWLAHVFEQRQARSLIRPRAEYVME